MPADPGIEQRRAMLRGAAIALVVAALVIGGIILVDRTGSDTTSSRPVPATTTEAPSITPPRTDTPGSLPPTTPTSTPLAPDPTPGATSSVTGPLDTEPPDTGPAATTATTATIAATVPATATVGAPSVDATSYAVLDVAAGRWMAEQQADEQLPVGSVMKLLTSYVVMQAGDPEHVATVPALELDPEESSIGLYQGEQLSRAVLLRAMLIVSANDAARTLANDIGGSVDGFVSLMNGAAASLGLTSTVAANPIGLDEAGAHSSARDMATLAALLMQDATFRTTVARTSASLHGQTFASTNASFLTGYPGADGVKTGHTTDAGYCLAASATRDGREVIVVVLGSSSEAARVSSAETLLDWAFGQP